MLTSIRSQSGVINFNPHLVDKAQQVLREIVDKGERKATIPGFSGLLVVIGDKFSGLPLPIPIDLKDKVQEKVFVLFDLSYEEQ